MTKLLIALIVLVVFGIFLVGVLVLLRSRRARRKTHTASPVDRPSSRTSHHRSLAVLAVPFDCHSRTCGNVNEKEVLLEKKPRETSSNDVPEIHITFPEEENSGEKRQSCRVVVVKIGDNGGVGLEPYNDEHLPPYEKADSQKLQSLDLERIGGLKELEKARK